MLRPMCALGLLVALPLGACFVPLTPEPARLDSARANALDLIMVGGARSFCVNGEAPQVRAVVTLEDGSRQETWAQGESPQGKLDFGHFELSSTYGVVDGQGRLQVPGDPFALLDRSVTIRGRLAARPELASEVTVEPRFDCGGWARHWGDAGVAGRTGPEGRRGRNGQGGDSSRRATHGEDGGDGGDGGAGGHGGPGPELLVALAYVDGGRHGTLVLARVERAGGSGPAYYLFDPTGPRFTISAGGGPGGNGGAGGRGGDGGFGGSNNISGGGDGGNGGDGGDGGRGGDGGNGGDGGRITVRFDARHPELPGLVQLDTAGGPAGAGGAAGSGGGPGPGGSSASGQRGATGRVGVAGTYGRPGAPGRDGPPPTLQPVPVGQLFAAERGRGIAIVVE